jgi:hypothetical protein
VAKKAAPGGFGAALAALVGQDVVIDTASSYLFIGRVQAATGHAVTLTDADVHDRGDSNSTKEKYVLDARKNGIKKNRKAVTVRTDTIVCVSRLDDVIEY